MTPAPQTTAELLQELRIECPGAHPADFHFTLESLHALESAEDTHFWPQVKRRLVLSLLRRFLSTQDFHLIDIGCGNGSLLGAVSEAFLSSKVAGMDGYLEGLIRCRKRSSDAHLFLHDILHLRNLHDQLRERYDAITVLDVLEHMDDPESAVRSMIPLLRPGGIVIATVPALQSLWSDRDTFLGHRKRYALPELRALFERQGFRILHASYLYAYMAVPVFLYRKILAPFRKHSGQAMEENELRPVPIVNSVLKAFGYFEVFLSRFLPLPFGTSAYCVAQKIA
ncbi:MAG: class I SAM-dependent methyltransferase [Candidatus Peregrinibacteria bacterium]